jgi:hypothetical protein
MKNDLKTNGLNENIDVYLGLKEFFLERIKILEEKEIGGSKNEK